MTYDSQESPSDALKYIPVVLAAAEALPTLESVQDILVQLDAVEKRGYFLPDGGAKGITQRHR